MCDRACGLESDKDSALRKKVLLKLSEEVSQCVCVCERERERDKTPKSKEVESI